MEFARFSSYPQISTAPDNLRGASKGKNSIFVLAAGRNEPKGQETTGDKVVRVVIENYLRRPSLKEEAMQKMTEFAHDTVCIQQSPAYQVECDVGMLMTHGEAFRWLCAGDVRILHFVNGQIMHMNEGKSPSLGVPGEKTMPELLSETRFEKGENSFLICSGSMMKYLKQSEIENALSLSDSPEEWLQTLRDLYEDRCGGEPYSIMTVFLPQKKKRMPKKTVIIAIALVVLLVAGFFALGAMRRRGEGPNGPQRPPMSQQGAPGMEPTEPPAPPEGGGIPGERPTQPPKPTEPPRPEETDPPTGEAG